MKRYSYLLIVFSALISLNSCSNDDEDYPCSEANSATMVINGESREFQVFGRGIDINSNGTGYTLSFWLSSLESESEQDSYSIVIKLPYQRTGTDIIERFGYVKRNKSTRTEEAGDVVTEGELENRVYVNKNTCFRATFSGNITQNGTELVITEGSIEQTYDEPF
ncbi:MULTISPECIES: hypothetical protein [unclassified Leeuwenhoekiella]|uniref:hypothetical protein n=1 Tax=unclassified Leeuwenhoekiella TaxID=2615029 RepID=UPI000C361D14|nr:MULTISPECIES: hypothetical protein [unclassified Leeuwenhoekiella]MAW96927.1 hypothetical protein [Leeuwenhoekiella sp.]MBA80631.1 hypothetical protein [Leeuwenhoekiella sp.]|tara:strand:+ start:3076 stop:3570 length:495 start_codon:yes stop_codon:yes gene_type:complete